MSKQLVLPEEVIERIIGESEVYRLTNLSRTTRWRLEREGKSPKRVHRSRNRVGWRAEEILSWMAMLLCGCTR
jgi:prophage regulatory protein